MKLMKSVWQRIAPRIKQILDNIIDYTQSHFTFEESLQEGSGL